MANGNYESRRSRRIGKRKLAMVLSLVLLMAMAIGGTMAFLITRSENVANTFAPGHVGCDVSVDNVKNMDIWTVKPDKKTNATVYLRAEVVANYAKEEDGATVIHWSQPKIDLENVADESEDTNIFGSWSKIGDYYYFSDEVAPSHKDNVRRFKIVTTGTPPAGYTLQIQVLGEAIQADPDEVNWNKSGMNN